jgi:hypothetical protein
MEIMNKLYGEFRILSSHAPILKSMGRSTFSSQQIARIFKEFDTVHSVVEFYYVGSSPKRIKTISLYEYKNNKQF